MADEFYMQRCLDLAVNGAGKTYPNPLVGAVLVHDERIIGEGYHRQHGTAHAEVNAIESVPEDLKRFIKDATLYVNLEPCCFHGKTPPCTDLIIRHGIKKVIVGCIDPHPGVAGKGISILQDAGVEVVVGILETTAKFFNRRLYTFHRKKRPYVILKWAETADRMMGQPGKTVMISNETVRRLVHKWRMEEQAIMAGTNTYLIDRPELTNRYWGGVQPVRVILDKNGRLKSQELKFTEGQKNIYITSSGKDRMPPEVKPIRISRDSFTPDGILQALYKEQIVSVLIEGGPALLRSFIEANLWDEARIIRANHQWWGNGIPSPPVKSEVIEVFLIGSDEIHILLNTGL